MSYSHSTNFLVFPHHLNHMNPMIFGGAFFSELDIAAAVCVKLLLKDENSICKSAVTHKYSGIFYKPCYLGDVIDILAKVTSVGKKSVVVKVEAKRDFELVADAEFVFVTILDEINVVNKPEKLPYSLHGISL